MLLIENFYKIDCIKLDDRYSIYQLNNTDTNKPTYDFSIIDTQSSWNYPYFECTLCKQYVLQKLIRDGYPLDVVYMSSPHISGGNRTWSVIPSDLKNLDSFISFISNNVLPWCYKQN